MHPFGSICIVVTPENHPDATRILSASQGSADDAGQKGPLGGADAGLGAKDRRSGAVFGRNDYIFHTHYIWLITC